jgi:hypothetical protein
MYVRPPRFCPESKKWVVKITTSRRWNAKVVETMKFDDREPAYNAYRLTMKELGYGL